jgi:hypothetical protein
MQQRRTRRQEFDSSAQTRIELNPLLERLCLARAPRTGLIVSIVVEHRDDALVNACRECNVPMLLT